MNNEIFIEADKALILEAYTPVASQMMSSIGEIAEGIDEIDETFSIADLTDLLNKVCAHMSGKFEVRQTPSDYCQIVYEPYVSDESGFDAENFIPSNFVDPLADPAHCLWISEKVFRAFVDRKLYGIAFALYFYLGYLMTSNESFAVSHNISFSEIAELCNTLSVKHLVRHRTTLMRAIADLQDAGLIKWHAEAGTFELLHITPYDPIQKV